jgi:hypothetical protein
LAAERGEVEVIERAVEQVGASSVGGVGVEDVRLAAEEGAEAVAFASAVVAHGQEFGLVAVVVLDRRDGLVAGNVEVVVELAAI